MTTAPTVTTANPTLHSNHHYPTSCSFIHHLISASQFSIQLPHILNYLVFSPAHTLYLQFRSWLIRCIHFQYLCSFVAYISWWYAFHFYMYWFYNFNHLVCICIISLTLTSINFGCRCWRHTPQGCFLRWRYRIERSAVLSPRSFFYCIHLVLLNALFVIMF